MEPEAIMKPRKNSKRPQFDLAPRRADCLELPARYKSNHHVQSLRVLDLFCGAGGMSLGFESAGFQISLGIDSDTWATKTFAANVDAPVALHDIEKISDFRACIHAHGIDSIDGIIGGPPCQGFSRVGRGRIRHQNRLEGFEADRIDPRNHLYQKFVEAVGSLSPRFFVMENVPDLDLYEDSDGRVIEHIVAAFTALGYHVERRILKAVDFGVPQDRSRLFIVGLRCPLESDFIWPDPDRYHQWLKIQTLREAIGDLPHIADNHLKRVLPYTRSGSGWLWQWYRDQMPNPTIVYDHITRPHREDDKQTFREMNEGDKSLSE